MLTNPGDADRLDRAVAAEARAGGPVAAEFVAVEHRDGPVLQRQRRRAVVRQRRLFDDDKQRPRDGGRRRGSPGVTWLRYAAV